MIFLLYALISLSIAAFDQFFKFWVVANIPLGVHPDLVPGIVRLTHIHTTGAAFSIFENMRVFLLIITTLSIAVIIVYMVRAKLTVTARIALSMILGGAVGNAIDRIVNGYVVDMFDLDFMEYAIFNVADCFIVVGGVMFCLYYIIETLREEKTKRAGSESMADADEISDGDIDDTRSHIRRATTKAAGLITAQKNPAALQAQPYRTRPILYPIPNFSRCLKTKTILRPRTSRTARTAYCLRILPRRAALRQRTHRW